MWVFQSSSNFLSCYCVSKNTKGRDEATLFSWLNQCNNHVGNSTAKFRGSALPCYTIQINLITYIFWRGRVGAGLRTGFNCQFQIMKILSEIFLLTQNRGSILSEVLTPKFKERTSKSQQQLGPETSIKDYQLMKPSLHSSRLQKGELRRQREQQKPGGLMFPSCRIPLLTGQLGACQFLPQPSCGTGGQELRGLGDKTRPSSPLQKTEQQGGSQSSPHKL